MWLSALILLVLTFLFFYVISLNKSITRCHEGAKNCFDGNGCYQYKGRGDKNESPEILLSRIDWLAKNSNSVSTLYTTCFILSYCITLSVIFILYAGSGYIVNYWELCLIFMACFIISFSISNLFTFHTDRYPNYYIRRNIGYLAERYNLTISEPPIPLDEKALKNLEGRVPLNNNFPKTPLPHRIPLPHRTEVQDVLSM